jgi:hypothetical protein
MSTWLAVTTIEAICASVTVWAGALDAAATKRPATTMAATYMDDSSILN